MKVSSAQVKLLLMAVTGLLAGDGYGGPVVKCPDGTYREAPCTQSGAAQPGIYCDPAHSAYAQCKRALMEVTGDRSGQASSDEQRQPAAAGAPSRARPYYPHWLTGSCDFLFAAADRDECRRQEKHQQANDRQLRKTGEAERPQPSAERNRSNPKVQK